MESLYSTPVASKRTGPLYNAFSYPTKIDPEAVALFIATHTRPHQSVLDVFAGSGSTGIAARLCDKPTPRMIAMAADLGLAPEWGPRRAVLYELSPVASLLSRVMCDPPSPAEFATAARAVVERAARQVSSSYAAPSPHGDPGEIRYVVWSDVLTTPCCRHELTLWDAAVEVDPAVFKSSFTCPGCGSTVEVGACERVTTTAPDPYLERVVTRRLRRPVRIYGRSGSKTWSRDPLPADLDALTRVEQAPQPVPVDPIWWGDLYRSGYHEGITHFHHLYTARNLAAVAALWRAIDAEDEHLRDALRLLVLSYNASHSTILTRVVAKRGQKDLVVTGAQSGVLYVSGLPVEKNVIEGVRRKISTFVDGFTLTSGSKSDVTVVTGSSTTLELPDDSIDYVFTDPPFGDFIPYAEINQLNETWLRTFTAREHEAIISRSQGKGVDDYATAMTEVFAEVARVLRPEGSATVVFHASKPAIWEALGEAFRQTGFAVRRTSILDKTQVSFKQVVSEGSTRGDAVFLLERDRDGRDQPAQRSGERSTQSVDELIKELETLARADRAELGPRRMYSRYVAKCVEAGEPVSYAAPEFYRLIEDHRAASTRRTRTR